MRIALMIGGVLLLILIVVSGVAAWWIVRPMRFAGIDRDPARATAGTLVELERPDITRRELVELLRARDFDTLTRIIETRNQRAQADPNEEWELGRVIDGFSISDDSFTDLFEDWVQAKPTSYAPLLAAAEHRFALAYLSRGTDYASNTTPEQMQGMAEQLVLLAEDVGAALRIEPNLSEGYRQLINLARMAGDQRVCGVLAEEGLGVMPASLRIRWSLAMCRLPRWGGSYDRITAIANEANDFVVDHGRLAALHGIVEWDKGRLADGDQALGHFSTALDSGEHAAFYYSRALEHHEGKRYAEALEDLDAALELNPDEPDYLVRRLYALVRLGRNDEVPAIVELVETIDPINAELPGFKKFALDMAAYEGSQIQKEQPQAAIERLNAGIALNGGDAQAFHLRGAAYLKAGDLTSALADFERAIRLDPEYIYSYRGIDMVLAQRGDWAGIIEHWNRYLARKPNDAAAIFERAGAFKHGGNPEAAMADARKACDLGLPAACAVAGR